MVDIPRSLTASWPAHAGHPRLCFKQEEKKTWMPGSAGHDEIGGHASSGAPPRSNRFGEWDVRAVLMDSALSSRRLEHPQQQPDGDHDDRAEEEVAPRPGDGVPAHVPDAAHQALDAAQDV